MRGAFTDGRGLVIPNNITVAGRQSLLEAALKNIYTPLYVGLCVGTYEDGLQVEDLEEPTLGVNGYVRKLIPRDITGWITEGTINNEAYLETDWLIWVATGSGFDKPMHRMFICFTASDTDGDVFALSGTLPAERTILAATAEADRKFKYTIYSR